MLKHLMTVVAQSVIIDKLTSNASYLNVIDGFAFPQLPATLPPMHIASVWLNDRLGETLHTRHRLVGPSGKDVFLAPNNPGAFNQSLRLRQINILGGFTLTESGRHWLLTERMVGTEWTEEFRLPIEVEIVNAGQQQAQFARRAEEVSTAGLRR